jgi:hypothetical protein
MNATFEPIGVDKSAYHHLSQIGTFTGQNQPNGKKKPVVYDRFRLVSMAE